MTDIEKPFSDPFSLIGDSWPGFSETSYTQMESSAKAAATTARDQSVAATTAADGMPDDLVGLTGDAAEQSYRDTSTSLTTAEFNLTSIAGWMVDCAGRIRTAKSSISDKVDAGTEKITKTLGDEMAGRKPSPTSEELKQQYRDDISKINDDLATELKAITDGELTAPAYVRAPASTPENPDATRKAVAEYNSGDAPTVMPAPEMPTLPTAVQNVVNATDPAKAPSPDNPFVKPSTPTTPVPQAPTQTVTTAPAAPAPTEGTPSTSAPSAPETPADSRTATSPEKPTTPEEKAPEASPLVAPSIPVPDPTGLTNVVAEAVPTALSAAEPAISAGAPPVVQSAPGIPVNPQGLTPGVPVAPPVMGTPPAAQGLGAMVPPNAPQVAQPQAAPGGLPPASPQPQAANQPVAQPQPLRAPDGTLIAQGVAQNQAQGDTPKKGEAIGLAALDSPVVADLSDDRELHTVLALLRDQYTRAKWDTPLAVARIHRDDESVIVWTTADAISLWAPGVLVPEGVLPLDMIPGITAHLGLMGLRRPGAKLAALLLDTGWDTDFVLTTESQDTMEGGPPSRRQPADDAAQITAQGSLLMPSISRADAVSALWEVGDPMSAMTMLLLGDADQPMSVSDAGSALRSLRWTEAQSADYLTALTTWYRADAVAAMADADMAETAYPAAQYRALHDALQPTQ